MRLPVKHALPLAALILIAGCGFGGKDRNPELPVPPANGPAADYPMVIGDPFAIDGVTYTPADRLNSDEVGFASVGAEGGEGVSAAHKTLPLPSYVEVTSLRSGRTILARLERRGPMSNDHLIELSPGAAEQLGIAGAEAAPVRVRRVNPPEQERAMLRAGGQAPARMDTPKALLDVLIRKLDSEAKPAAAAPVANQPATTASDPVTAVAPPPPVSEAAPPAPPAPPPAAVEAAATPTPSKEPETVPAAPPAPTPAPAAKPPVKSAATHGFSVQVATFSTQDRAKSAAARLGGEVRPSGRFWLTRLGPFATQAEAKAALAKAKAAGYSDARILRAD